VLFSNDVEVRGRMESSSKSISEVNPYAPIAAIVWRQPLQWQRTDVGRRTSPMSLSGVWYGLNTRLPCSGSDMRQRTAVQLHPPRRTSGDVGNGIMDIGD